MADQQTDDELNRLYWESDEPVSAIAERLGISRRALYDGITPRPAGVPCPECGAPLEFRNRTAAENREAECPECGSELEVEAERDEEGETLLEDPTVEQERAAAPLSPTRRVPASGSGPMLGLALLIGVALGALAAYFLRRR